MSAPEYQPPSAPVNEPAFTPAWFVAVAQFAVFAGLAFGLELDAAQQAAVVGGSAFVGGVVAWADAKLRAARNARRAAEAAAASPSTTSVRIG